MAVLGVIQEEFDFILAKGDDFLMRLALVLNCEVVRTDGLKGKVKTLLHHDLVEIDDSTCFVNEQRFSKAGGLAHRHATLGDKVDFVALEHV